MLEVCMRSIPDHFVYKWSVLITRLENNGLLNLRSVRVRLTLQDPTWHDTTMVLNDIRFSIPSTCSAVDRQPGNTCKYAYLHEDPFSSEPRGVWWDVRSSRACTFRGTAYPTSQIIAAYLAVVCGPPFAGSSDH